ncbi:helix-turn-helix domain-containing protein [Mycobacterium avium subsp. hominissuis]|nr:helix-turn-helix domain-containing protein [Mycobacterium avium subsp. hominissuis]
MSEIVRFPLSRYGITRPQRTNAKRKLCVMPLLRISEVADELRVSPRIVQKWIHDGQLPARRYGARVVRVDRSDLDAFGRSAVDA